MRLRRAMAIVHLKKVGARLEGYADTFRGSSENLLGLSLLWHLRLLLDGPKEQALLF